MLARLLRIKLTQSLLEKTSLSSVCMLIGGEENMLHADWRRVNMSQMNLTGIHVVSTCLYIYFNKYVTNSYFQHTCEILFFTCWIVI